MLRRRQGGLLPLLSLPLLSLVSLLPCVACTVGARRVLLYVDPSNRAEGAETAAVLAALERAGAECVQLWSGPTANSLCEQSPEDLELVRRVRALEAPGEGEELEWVVSRLNGAVVEGVICGSDGGLATAERLQHVLVPARSNGIEPARRDKFEMNQKCRAAGIPVAAQAAPSTWAEAASFLKELSERDELRAVLKPRRGQASVGVHLVHGWTEARAVYEGLMKYAVSNDATEVASGCVLQEVLVGREWIVDTVSRNGQHKALALWRYDKGEANGAPFVYFGVEARGVESDEEEQLVSYAMRVLDALGWRWGPAHLEIMSTTSGPRLVEINAGRWNGLDFKLIADVCFGGNAYDAGVAAYLDPTEFESLPDAPPCELACSGMLVVLCSYVQGKVIRMCNEIVDGMESLVAFEPTVQPGGHVSLTRDLDSAVGYAHLLHGDASVVEADYRRLRQAMPSLFEVESIRKAT